MFNSKLKEEVKQLREHVNTLTYQHNDLVRVLEDITKNMEVSGNNMNTMLQTLHQVVNQLKIIKGVKEDTGNSWH